MSDQKQICYSCSQTRDAHELDYESTCIDCRARDLEREEKQKPREFWFEYMQETNEYGQLSNKPPYVRDNSFELVHVIEYRAYEERGKMITEFINRAADFSREASTLKAKLFNLQPKCDKNAALIVEAKKLRDLLDELYHAPNDGEYVSCGSKVMKAIESFDKFLEGQ